MVVSYCRAIYSDVVMLVLLTIFVVIRTGIGNAYVLSYATEVPRAQALEAAMVRPAFTLLTD